MRKLFHVSLGVLALALSVLVLQGCTEDQEIGMTLEGTWRGAMSVYTEYGDHQYQSVYSEVQFVGDPFRTTKGSGYWVDYYDNHSGWRHNYIANHIKWRVENQIIRVHFKEEDADLEIRDFRLNDETFTGVVCYLDSRGNVVSQAPFAMTHVDTPNWNDYDYDYPSNYRSWAK